MTDNQQTPRRERSAPAVSNEDVLASRPSNTSITWLWAIAGLLIVAAIVLYGFTFSVDTDAAAETLLASARTLEVANMSLVGGIVALVGGLVVSGLRWHPEV